MKLYCRVCGIEYVYEGEYKILLQSGFNRTWFTIPYFHFVLCRRCTLQSLLEADYRKEAGPNLFCIAPSGFPRIVVNGKEIYRSLELNDEPNLTEIRRLFHESVLSHFKKTEEQKC